MNFETDNLKKQQSYSSSRMDADKMQADVDRLERDYHAQLSTYEQVKSVVELGGRTWRGWRSRRSTGRSSW